MIASSESRNSSKNLPRFSSNDMVHNYYIDKAKKNTQEKDRNSTTSLTPSARFQSTADDSKPKPRSNNQTPTSLLVCKSSCVTIMVVPKADHSKSFSSFSDSKNFVCSTYHKCVFNANHDACITKLLKEVNLHAKIQSHKTRHSNKLVDQKGHTQKPGRQIFTGHRFSPNKTSVVYEKTSPRSDLRWKPTGRIFKSVGLRWIPTGKLFDSCTSKVDSEPPHGSNVDIPHIHECKQTLDVSAGTSINVQKEQSLDLSAGTLCNVNKENLRVWLLKKLISQKPLWQSAPARLLKDKSAQIESRARRDQITNLIRPTIEDGTPIDATSNKLMVGGLARSVSTVIPTTVATTITAVSSRPRAKGIVFHEQKQEQEQAPTPIVSSQQPT
ncbi:hypothetical protein Tco_0363312 [Tanacetum coccineum]